jgi:hypothetical protein
MNGLLRGIAIGAMIGIVIGGGAVALNLSGGDGGMN